MKLPFGLSQKPLGNVFEHGSIKFNMRDGVMHYTVRYTRRGRPKFKVIKGIVRDREHLHYLETVKSFPIKIRALEVVN